jgi:hypothetical protein
MSNKYETGFCCPICNSTQSTVNDSRHRHGSRYRRRQCPSGHRYTTYEQVSAKENTMELRCETLGVLIEATDGNVYQVILNEHQTLLMMQVIAQIHDGTIRVMSEPKRGIILERNSLPANLIRKPITIEPNNHQTKSGKE